MALVEDEEMRVWVEKYAADKDLFFKVSFVEQALQTDS